MSSSTITLRQIAAKAGVHYSTVSLALRDHPSIPAATRERVKALARRMNYRPDPVLAALCAYRELKSPRRHQGVLAWIDASPERKTMRQIFHSMWTGAAARARALGWDLQEFRLAELGLSPKKFSEMLVARGIRGLFVAPLPADGGTLELEWAWFSAVTIGHTLREPRLHRVSPHQVHNVQRLLQILRELGYRRPGLAVSPRLHERTRRHWMAGYLVEQQELRARDRVPPLMKRFEEPRQFAAWLKRYRPDVIVSGKLDRTMQLVEAAGLRVPEDIGVAGTGIDYDAAGIDEGFDQIGRVAVETLVGLMHRQERGVPAVPMHILLEGRWRDGPTLRQAS